MLAAVVALVASVVTNLTAHTDSVDALLSVRRKLAGVIAAR